jgi:DNA (cytosine-5)-methyltransferase 1
LLPIASDGTGAPLSMRFVDLFAGLGGFHRALQNLGHECVFASEIDPELRRLYKRNFPNSAEVVYGDIREHKADVPGHDILCAGFPCQPFSKSGSQLGLDDQIRGTLFHEIVEVLERHHPEYVILENVGNFERHDDGRTWTIVQEKLQALGYTVRGTVHKKSGGHGLISPHHFGYPHTRDRFFIVARLGYLPGDPFPRGRQDAQTDLGSISQTPDELTAKDRQETALTAQQIECIEHWNALIEAIPEDVDLPSFPIWGDEINADYAFEDRTPFQEATERVASTLSAEDPEFAGRRTALLAHLPKYARTETFPSWKKNFIRGNRAWFNQIRQYFPAGWVEGLQQFPPSLRKLEWNCQGEERDVWQYVLQFRPSGLRVKRYTSIPTLVAMTTTQIPILGPEGRFISRIEGLRLQGFPDSHELPSARDRAFAALGNAVHVGVMQRIANALLAIGDAPTEEEATPDAGVRDQTELCLSARDSVPGSRPAAEMAGQAVVAPGPACNGAGAPGKQSQACADGAERAKQMIPDVVWEQIHSALPAPERERRGGKPRVPDRQVLTGILYVLQNDLAWSKLPADLGCGSTATCVRRMAEWRTSGAWEGIFRALVESIPATECINWDRISPSTWSGEMAEDGEEAAA